MCEPQYSITLHAERISYLIVIVWYISAKLLNFLRCSFHEKVVVSIPLDLCNHTH